MLTLLDSVSLAGDRTRQNDDASGAGGAAAWVIDGATDLHDEPVMHAASDAAWIAQRLNRDLMRFAEEEGRETPSAATLRYWLRTSSQHAGVAFDERSFDAVEPWKSPIASVLLVVESAEGLSGLDLGDCRLFAVDAAGRAHEAGGPPGAADRETQFAAAAKSLATGAGQALYRAPPVLDKLRESRARQNADPGAAIFSLKPECADHARAWSVPLARAAHVILATDGFSALVDRYDSYDAAGLVRAALDKGLHALGRELRDIETADASGEAHPRWKRSDDATALLLRLD